MDTNRQRRAALAAFALSFALLGPSCGGSSTNPPAESARLALDAALNAWRDGKKPTDLAGASPPVNVVDSEWTGGRKLAGFEVIRPEPSEADKRFLVKLTYAATPPASAEVIYIVLGSSPVSVFREDDFARTMNMDNNPTAKAKKKR